MWRQAKKLRYKHQVHQLFRFRGLGRELVVFHMFMTFMMFIAKPALVMSTTASREGSFDSAALRSGFRLAARTPRKRLKFTKFTLFTTFTKRSQTWPGASP